jgi:glutathione peroxidase
MLLRLLAVVLFAFAGVAARAESFRFASIDGDAYDTAEWQGRPVLVANTASLCSFTPQLGGLQALYDQYRDRGLIVLAVPSDDFRQELGSAEEVKEFCELNFALDLPMTDITHVKGADAHPFYRQVASETGFVPAWNFNKVLIGPDGAVVRTWGSATQPLSKEITSAVEELLN